MSAPERQTAILQPPSSGRKMSQKELYKFQYELWNRSGGFNSAVTNLAGLTASVDELNTMVGINTSDTVQEQLNRKADESDLGTMANQDADNVNIQGGAITSVTIRESDIAIPVNTTALDIPIGGTLHADTTEVGNVGTGEDTLITYATLASTFGADANYLEISAWGIVAANANNKTIKLKFGTQTILDTGAVAANAGSWSISAKIIRTTANTQQIIATITSDNTLFTDSATFTAGTQDLSLALDVFCTGEATADNDIVQKGLIIKWFK